MVEKERKKEDAGIMCNWRSEVDNSKKANITKNLERKIEGKYKKGLRECMWEILKNNGYKKNTKKPYK